MNDNSPCTRSNSGGDPHWLVVAEINADLRNVLAKLSKAKTWAHTADQINLVSVAQAAMTVSTKTTPPPEECAKHRALRLAAKRFLPLLIAARAEQMAAAVEYDLADYIEGQFAPAIAAAKEFAQPAATTAIDFIAAKMIREIELVNRNHKPMIPIGLGDDGPVVVMTRAALAHTHIDPLPSREAIGKHLRRAAR
jgi:hypothetical protein